jgi:sec-independent protein translocase protein TatA
MGSLSIWHWVIVLVVVVLVFGTKKIANVGSDLGKAVKGFKDGVKGEEEKSVVHQDKDSGTIDVHAKEKPRVE